MRARLPLAMCALLVVGCGKLTEVRPDTCADPDADWWPLPEGATWKILTNVNGVAEKVLTVEQRDDVLHHPLPTASWQTATAVRLERREPNANGWRWVRDVSDGTYWMRDLWSDGTDPPPVMDPRDANTDAYYDPYRIRFDTTPRHLCEGEGWRSEYRKITIHIETPLEPGAVDRCPRDVWNHDPAECIAAGQYTTIDVVEDWSVESVGRHFDVAGHSFDETVCVRRREVAGEDKTYCFAAGVGKFLEFLDGDPNKEPERLESWSIPP